MFKRAPHLVPGVLPLFSACATTPEKSAESIPLVREFDLNRVEGLWYEGARLRLITRES
jgi:lipocalin